MSDRQSGEGLVANAEPDGSEKLKTEGSSKAQQEAVGGDKLQPEESNKAQQEAAGRSVRKGGLVVAMGILLSLTWYLLADRYTPYTTQARIEGYVIGVAPYVAGRLTRVWVTNNQEVEKGQRLFKIDPSQYQIALNKARSDLDTARRQVGAGSATVTAARANLLAARANERKARQDASRLQRLYDEDPGTISVRLLEISRANADKARAQVTAAEADIQAAIEQMGGDDPANNTILKTALTAVDKAKLDLAHTLVKAPLRGVVTDLTAEVGQFAGTGTPVLTLIAIQDVWINAEFTENNLGHLDVGTPVEILFDALPGRVFQGRVRSVGLGVSAGRNQPPGALPVIQNDRDWLRQSQRFPVIIGFDTERDPALLRQLRIGGQASVIAYGEGAGLLLRLLGKAYIRLASWLSYAY
ncbi:MAG: HlyD family secretion protein [Nitrococcus sp.]|nr:HlyD family secretion protein [Nitrococcus sp.]